MGSHIERSFSIQAYSYIQWQRKGMAGQCGQAGKALQHYQNIDVAPDPFTYNGTTTTFESFWMGAPAISLKGNRHAPRVSAGISKNLGLEELIGNNEEAYTKAAVQLAQDTNKLASLRTSMRNRMNSSCVIAAG